MSIERVCEDFLQGGDSGVFLVAVSDHVNSGDSEEVARTVLQEKYQTILVQLGWDLLSLLTPHLRCHGSHCWRLLCRITEVCSPKEMVLALLEQMEVVSDTSVFLLMLQPLQKVLLRLERETVLVSSLRSTSSLVQQHYSRLEGEGDREGSEQRDLENGSESSDLEPSGVTNSSSIPGDGPHSVLPHSTSGERHNEGEGVVQEDQTLEDKKEEQSIACRDGRLCCSEETLTVHLAVAQMLEFVQPFVEEIHQQYCSVKEPLTHWSGRQRECITLLLSLLDYPLVARNLKPGSRTPNESRTAAESIMGAVVRCHCGCVKLMEWESGGLRVRRKRKGCQEGEEENSCDQESGNDWMHDDSFPLLPPLGLACFVYLLMVEGVQHSYLPTIVRQDYLLHINLVHVTTLLGRPEKPVTMKGLALLKVLLFRASTHSLPSYLLDNKRYLQLAELLTNLMITCVHKSVRQKCVPLLLDLISCFKDTGRHRIYRSLFHSVDHAGVLGLLIHNIKNEVDQALKAVPADNSPFLSPKLVPLLDLILRVSVDTDLLKESDRVMAALNFLRYLLIRDKLAENQTGLWSALVKVRDQFMTPLRSLLVATKAHCKHEVEMRKEEAQTGTGVSRQDSPEVTVEVRGAKLPNVNPKDEIKVLLLAQHHLDMMESVIVRVEELMDS